MKKYRFLCLILIIACAAPCLGGCGAVGTKRELDSLAIVLGLAIDKADGSEDVDFENYGEESDRLLLTAQVVRTLATSSNSSDSESAGQGSDSGSGSGSGGGDLGNTYWNVKTVGGNILESLRSAIHVTNRRLYFAHNQAVIISREAAEESVAKYLDYFFRDHETRYDVNLVIAEGKAGEVLDVGSHLEAFPAQDLSKLIDRQRDGGFAPHCSLFSFLSDYEIPYKSALVPYVKVVKPDDGKMSPYLYVAGSAVFVQDRMVTALSEKQTRGAEWLLDNVNSGVVALSCEGSPVSLEIMKSSGGFRAEYGRDGCGGGKIKIKGSVRATCVVGEYQGKEHMDSDMMQKLCRECENEINKEIYSAFYAVRGAGSDIFGIGEYFYRYRPGVWKDISRDFEELYGNSELETDVSVDIIRTGSLIEPADADGGGYND